MMSMFQNAEAFSGTGIEDWDCAALTDMSFMFKGALNFNTNLASWNTAKLEAIKGAFQGASLFTGDDIGSWDLSRVQDFSLV